MLAKKSLCRSIPNKDLYSSSTGTKVDATLDTRLLTEDGRNQIAEDIERTKRLGEAIGDVVSSDSLNIKDTFDHNGVNIENAKIAILGKYGSTYTNGDNTNSNVYLDKILNQNALQTANTLGHEVAHVRQNQGQTYLRDTTQLQEEYANLFGNYSSNGLDFSSYVYNNVKLNNIPSLNLNLTSQDVNTLKTNTSLYVKDLSKANSGDGRVDDESYWTLQDMNRAKDLQSDNASDRIKALIETGNTESEVLKQVINDGTLRGLSQEEFNKIYSEQKQQVDDTNKLVDIEANSLKTISLALGGREITKNILESISKKTVETSIKNAIASGVEDLSTQVGLQIFDIIYNEPAILNQINNNPADTLNEIYNKIDLEKLI